MTTKVRLRLKAELTLLLVSVIAIEVSDMVAAIGVGFKYSDVPSPVLIAFHIATMALVNYWIRVDALSAFDAALKERQVRFGGDPLRIVYVAKDCPRRWLVALHIQLHPSLLGLHVND